MNRSQKRPNFVILFADDIGYGDLGANRESPAESDTPFMDQLASKGTRLVLNLSVKLDSYKILI